MFGERTAGTDLPKIEIAERECFTADGEPAGKQRIAARANAVDMIARHGCELERLLRWLESRQQGAARELADNGPLGGRPVVRHPAPLSALMFSR